MKSFSYLYAAVLFFVFLLLPTTIAAQARADRPSAQDITPEAEKIRILEDQIAELKRRLDELTALIKSPVETAGVGGSPTPAVESPGDTKTAETVPAAQQKPELGVNVGSARLTPYGSVYFNAFTNSGGTNNADVPLFATPAGRRGTGFRSGKRGSAFGSKVQGPETRIFQRCSRQISLAVFLRSALVRTLALSACGWRM